jgi:hypothetical protein
VQAQAAAAQLFQAAAATNTAAALLVLSFCVVASPCLNAGVCVDVAAADVATDANAAALYRCDCTPFFTDAVCSTPVLKVISLAPSSVSIFGGVIMQLYGKCTRACAHTPSYAHMRTQAFCWFGVLTRRVTSSE